jgi:hypothetical protein
MDSFFSRSRGVRCWRSEYGNPNAPTIGYGWLSSSWD